MEMTRNDEELIRISFLGGTSCDPDPLPVGGWAPHPILLLRIVGGEILLHLVVTGVILTAAAVAYRQP